METLKRAADDHSAAAAAHAHKKPRSEHTTAAPAGAEAAAASSSSSPPPSSSAEHDPAALVPDDSQLHPRSLYRLRGPPDFLELAEADQHFRPFVTVHRTRATGAGAAAAGAAAEPHAAGGSFGTLDWKDPRALLSLTSVLLRRDFGLRSFSMPLHHLVPPVPQRLNYVHWVAELIGAPQESTHQITDDKTNRHQWRGLDIGTGASCIFPLLGACVYGFDWVATEVDPESLSSARAILESNALQSKIELRPVAEARSIVDGAVLREDERFDFSVCNPPFFESLESTGCNRHRSAAATPSELVCPGGEEQFVASMIAQSKARPDQIRWCTTMLGRKSSLKSLLALLHSKAISAAVVQQCEFLQGTQARWGLAWTFDKEERNKQEDKLRSEAKPANTAAVAAAASASSSSSSAAATSHSSLFVVSESVTARARFRIQIRHTSLNGDQLLAKLRESATQYAAHHRLVCTLSNAVNAGVIEFAISMRACCDAPSPGAAPVAVAWQCAVRLVAAPPSDWIVELEWKKLAGAASERTQAQMGFSLFATYLTRLCVGGLALS